MDQVDSDIERQISVLKNLSFKLIDHANSEFLKEKALRVYAESDEHVQELIKNMLHKYDMVIRSNNIRRIYEASEEIEDLLYRIESRQKLNSIFNNEDENSGGGRRS